MLNAISAAEQDQSGTLQIELLEETRMTDDRRGEETIRVGNITLWLERYTLTVDGRTRQLTPVQFRLLQKLASQPNRIFTASELHERESGSKGFDAKKAVRQRIYRIRLQAKISSRQLQTVRGEGYRLLG
jgi:DNA-binding response OmpR family regulator